ncbi:MAG: hypothetical protein IT343_22810 [Candidatus Melainabacteria bacterium]|jgi:hypothetical protein|nr:hypothetical protein [Candidatus Melainabacteria bacterium]
MTKFPSRKVARQNVLTALLVLACFSGAQLGHHAGAQTGKGLSNAQLTEIIRDPSVGSRALSVSVVGTGPAVTVLAEEKETATDKDLKIDAVFLAKALIEGASGQIEKVKVLFSQSGKGGRHITVARGEINDYGSGKLSAEKLLGSLSLVAVHADNTPEISDGPEVERRLLVWKRIDKLRSKGTGVSPFEAIFKEIQGLAKTNDAEKVAQRLTYLESKLTEQEEQVKQARDSLRGRGVPSIKTAANPAPSSTPAHAPAGANPPASSTEEENIPVDAERVKSVFNAQGNDIISQVMRKNSTDGYRLRDLKIEIEKQFRQHEEGKAFASINLFDKIATKSLGHSFLTPSRGGRGGMGPGGGPPF